ncbi:DUF6227 family protein [Streptomyces bambusae]|uniref:DUF6227 family protein n=1 Tax=Streptomyces bambusae TaxID=1550616 RepID=UPI001CFE3B53|nr:DUF6227 family protein [Streptomyces bambusae]MCB5166386.1 DUF6227 family protein [Streptomyces bambusae]
MSDPYETTEAHLDRLLGRALNSFDLPDLLVERLGTALAHSSALHSSHHSTITGLHRETYRHTHLLADGSAVSLWELAYRSDVAEPMRHELFGSRTELVLAVERLFGGDSGGPAAELEFHGLLPGDEGGPDADATGPAAELFGRMASLPEQRRTYAVDESADHARRVLRRAENADRPGPDTARLLRTAYAHQITQAFGRRQYLADGRDAGFSLYEHAFVLLDGTELSLWEVEHTATPDGRHMCEVYASETAAREAMEVRARVR